MDNRRSMNLGSGLSLRVRRTLEEAETRFGSSVAKQDGGLGTTIDLSTAQTEVIHKELVEFLKTTTESKLTGEVLAHASLTSGEASLKGALASFFNSYFNPIHAVQPEHIVLTAGATDALEGVIHAVSDDGDSVLIPGPYSPYYETAFKTRANVNIVVAHPPTYVNYDNYLLPALQAAYDFSADKTRIKAVVLSNPHNPLARCFPQKAIVDCMEFCQENNLHLIIDEMLALTALKDLPSSTSPFISALSLTEPLVLTGAVKVDPSRVHVVWSASKLFGLGGLEVGCLISQQNPELCKAVDVLTAGHVNSFAAFYLPTLLNWAQLPTLIALNTERLSESYRLLSDALHQWDVKFVQPTHGIFLFAKLGKYMKSPKAEQDFFNRLAVHGVRVAPGQFFRGVELDYGWARIRFSVSPNTMRLAIAQISTFLARQA